MNPRKTHFILTASSAILLAPVAYSLDGTWTNLSGGSWATAGNWTSNTIADGSGFTANFTGMNITADTTIGLNGARTIGNLVFSDTDTGSAGSWIIATGSGGPLTLAGTTPTITVNALGTGKFAQINAVLAGTNGFTKTGAGALLLNNASNSISGAVVLSQGNIQLNGAALTNATTVTLNGGTLVVATSTNAIGGTISFGGGLLQHNNAPAATDYSAKFNTAAGQNYRISVTAGASLVTYGTSLSSAGGTLEKAGPGKLILAASNTYNGSTTVSAGTLEIQGSIANSSSISISSGAALAFNSASAQSYGNAINGGGALAKQGGGTLTLSAANNYSGGTTLSAGTLNFANANALGGGAVSFTDNATLQAGGAFTVANAVSIASGKTGTLDTNGNATTLSGALTGSGTLTKTGGGALTLTAGLANTLGGGINVNAGRLEVTDGLSLTNAPGTITVASGAAFNYSKNFGSGNNLTNALHLSGAGADGFGALNLRGNVTATGAITLDGDTTISHDFNNATISGSITGADRSLTLTTTQSAQPGLVVSGTISLGTGGITVNGAGGTNSVTLSGNNSYSGGTIVSTGSLLVNNSAGSGTGSGAVTVNSGAALGGTGRINGAVNVSGVLSPGASIESLGTGALTLNNGSNFKYELDTVAVAGDLLHVTGGLNIGSNVTLDLTDLAAISEAMTAGTKLTLISYTGAWNDGTFDGYADDSTFLFANNQWRINYNDLTGGSNFTSDQTGATGFVTLAVIPEPSSSGLLGLGGLVALLARRRRGN
jgi:fibronectin-binding autotransporter adhesin